MNKETRQIAFITFSPQYETSLFVVFKRSIWFSLIGFVLGQTLVLTVSAQVKYAVTRLVPLEGEAFDSLVPISFHCRDKLTQNREPFG
jgi:hypothetical protein